MAGLFRGLAYFCLTLLTGLVGMLAMITGGPPSGYEIAQMKAWAGKVYVAALSDVEQGARDLRAAYCAAHDSDPPSDRPCV